MSYGFKRINGLRRNLYLLPANEFFAELRFYYPVAVLAFQDITGSFTKAMAVFAIMNIVQSLMEIPTGIFSDKVGRRKTFITGALCELLGGIAYAGAFLLPQTVELLFVGAALFGTANALFSGNNYAMLYETLSHYRRTDETSNILGRTASMGQAALAITGLCASALLFGGLEYKHLILFSLCPAILGFICAILTIEPPQHIMKESGGLPHIKKAYQLLMANPKLRKIAAANAINKGLGYTSNSFIPGFIELVWPLWLTPLYRTVQNGIGSISFWFSGKIIKKFGLVKSLFGGAFCSFILSGVAYISATFISPLLLLLTQISYATTTTSSETLQQEEFSNEQRSTMGSIISFAGSIIGGIGALITGIAADSLGPAQALLILLALEVPVILIYKNMCKHHV